LEQPQTANTDASTPASSAAPVTAQATLDSLSHDERQSWELTGEFPDRISVGGATADATPTDVAADSSPAVPDDQAAATAASPAPASEPGKPAKEKGAKARSAELDAEIAEMRERLRVRAQLREELARVDPPQTRTAASSPAAETKQAEWERIMAQPGAPKEDDFQSYGAFTAAAAHFVTNAVLQEHTQRQTAESAFRREIDSVRQMGEQAQSRVAAFAESTPDFASKVNPHLLEIDTATARRLSGQPIGPQHVLAEQVATSERVGELLIHFSTPEGQADWNRLVRSPSLLRDFGRLEERLGAAASAPAPKHVSDAPAPQTVLGQRPADTSDPMDSAIKRKDQAAYAREANKRDLAAMGL
jgi:hypothetical protein